MSSHALVSSVSIRRWLLSIETLVILMVVIGGITRLTQSGLSVVKWNLIMGSLPPLSLAAWTHAFDQYKQFPQYQIMNLGMTLAEFKGIFFWEYFHRLVGRLAGLVILLPYAYFLFKKKLSPTLIRCGAGIGALVIAQGMMGWIMVASGLVDRPSVSHFRLTAHLLLAFLLYLAAFMTRKLVVENPVRTTPQPKFRSALKILVLLAVLQIVFGAFVAGMKAGLIMNTFPKMGGAWIPPGLLALTPIWANPLHNPIMTQWLHRLLGISLLIAAWGITWIAFIQSTTKPFRQSLLALSALVLGQVGLGIVTLVFSVPIPIAILHQVLALFILRQTVWIYSRF